jgi:hypothetical protein
MSGTCSVVFGKNSKKIDLKCSANSSKNSKKIDLIFGGNLIRVEGFAEIKLQLMYGKISFFAGLIELVRD